MATRPWSLSAGGSQDIRLLGTLSVTHGHNQPDARRAGRSRLIGPFIMSRSRKLHLGGTIRINIEHKTSENVCEFV